MQRIACIHFPGWPIQRLVVQRPELRRQRIALVRQHPQRGQIVACASPLALQSGVRIDMPVTEAKSLLRAALTRRQPSASQQQSVLGDAPQFHLLPYEPGVDEVALTDLARSLDSFSPLIGLDTQDPPSCLLLNLTGLGRLFGDEETLAQRLREHLEQAGYVPRIALAPTVGAAWALATATPHPSLVGHSTLNPPGTRQIQIAPTHFSWELLDPLPPSALRIASDICQTLDQLGLTTVGSLRNIPGESLTSRFDDSITRRIQQAAGNIPEAIRSVSRSTTFHASQHLDFPLRDQTTVLVVIERLIDQVCRELKQIRQGALVWYIRLNCQDTTPLQLRIGLFQASSRTDQIMPLVKMQLEQDRSFDGNQFPVEEVLVSAAGTVRLVEHQGQLFEAQPGVNEAEWGGLLNRLAIRLGEDNVVSAACVAGAQPERSVEYRPLVGPRSVRQRRSQQRLAGNVMDRPLRLFPEPIELSWPNTSGSMTLAKVAPGVSFRTPGSSPWIVQRCWGPERIETAWWHGRTIRRDYWRVESDAGAQYWIYRDLRTQRWFLHGTF